MPNALRICSSFAANRFGLRRAWPTSVQETAGATNTRISVAPFKRRVVPSHKTIRRPGLMLRAIREASRKLTIFIFAATEPRN